MQKGKKRKMEIALFFRLLVCTFVVPCNRSKQQYKRTLTRKDCRRTGNYQFNSNFGQEILPGFVRSENKLSIRIHCTVHAPLPHYDLYILMHAMFFVFVSCSRHHHRREHFYLDFCLGGQKISAAIYFSFLRDKPPRAKETMASFPTKMDVRFRTQFLSHFRLVFLFAPAPRIDTQRYKCIGFRAATPPPEQEKFAAQKKCPSLSPLRAHWNLPSQGHRVHARKRVSLGGKQCKRGGRGNAKISPSTFYST